MSTTDTEARAAMPDVLAAVADELSLAMGQCARLDGALGQLLDAAPPERRGALMQELHTVDLLNQQIAALAGFLGRLSSAAANQPSVDVAAALRTITLGDVAERISRGVGHVREPQELVTDDLDLF